LAHRDKLSDRTGHPAGSALRLADLVVQYWHGCDIDAAYQNMLALSIC
jgi:hypothetical protein